MRAAALLLLLMGTTVLAGCSESDVAGPQGREAGIAAGGSSAASKLGVITRNLYVGTNVDAVISALLTPGPGDDLDALVTAIGTIQRTDFPARAAAIADEIAKARPHAVGLQEVSQIDLTLPPLGVDIHQDFLSILLAELEERELGYDVAAKVKNIEAAPFPGVSLVDFDVLLMDTSRVDVGATTAQNFTANLGTVAPGVILKRGWVTATVTIEGTELVLASTHLESGNLPGFAELRAAQAQELVGSLDPATPAVLIGDLNDAPGSPMYQVLVGAGFIDAWGALRPGVVGNTCCHLDDLSNKLPDLSQRIDYIFARGLERSHAGLIGKVERLGEVPADRLAGPLGKIWPSDHAGLFLSLLLSADGEDVSVPVTAHRPQPPATSLHPET
ncbi:MAG: endonuclease/exonuclease/phosphatase family protein [Gemmatimonadales bacterium]